MHSNATDVPIYDDFEDEDYEDARNEADTERTIDRWLAAEEDRYEARMGKI